MAAPSMTHDGRPRLTDCLGRWDGEAEGEALYALVSRLYPLCRSITGEALRASLRVLAAEAPIVLHEVPSGTAVFDWTVPNEWTVRDACVKNLRGERVIDFRAHTLHLVGYSAPISARLTRAELEPHLFSLPDAPGWIPYRTSYYRESWGFCVTERQRQALTDHEYDVLVDSTLAPGHLTYGECRLQGETDDEVLVSCHSCHPSLCNDNLSGMAVAARLASHLAALDLRHSFRFVWVPGTIGAIAWLAANEAVLGRIRHGLVVSGVGDPGAFTYKRSRRGNADIDRIVPHVLARSGKTARVRDFTPTGYDERQYCSPGIDLPVGCFMRSPAGEYPQYHTSADDLGFVTPQALAESLQQLLHVVAAIEANRRYLNLSPKGEPQLGRRGLYRSSGGARTTLAEDALLWVLSFSDGRHDLLDIAERSTLDLPTLERAASELVAHGLLAQAD